MTERVGDRFDRLPATAEDRTVTERASREAVRSFWADRFGVPPSTFDGYSFWERGAGNVWAFRGEVPSPIAVQGLGMHVLRTGGEHWKPTTNAVQRFGTAATRNVLILEPGPAAAFVAGEDQPVAWDGDWGYLIVARELAGLVAPVGVGLFIDGELRSQVPKGRRRTLSSDELRRGPLPIPIDPR